MNDWINERRLVIVTESLRTDEIVVLRVCDEGGRSEERDVGVWSGEEERTAEQNWLIDWLIDVDGGDNDGNWVGPGGAERSGEESECVEDADYDGFNELTAEGDKVVSLEQLRRKERRKE